MPLRARDAFFSQLSEGIWEPTDKRVRVVLAERTIVDTTGALLVWEPRRIVPSYAVAVKEIDAELLPSAEPAGEAPPTEPSLGDLPVLHPGIPFRVHTLDGASLTVRAGPATVEAAAFRPTDPALAEHAILDFVAFDAWYEEDERIVGHPRDPFHRIDILHSSRHVHVELDGRVLAESSRPYLLFETNLPVRFYLPEEEVRMDILVASATSTYCAYKGQASYWSTEAADDVAWTYTDPLREAAEVAGRVAFFNERVDIVVDGQPLPRPRTPWS